MTRFDRVIPPGKEGKLLLKVNTASLKGRKSKSVTVITNDSEFESFELSISADVQPSITVLPSDNLGFGAVEYGEPSTKFLTIKGEPGRPLTVSNPRSNFDYVKVALDGDGGEKGATQLKVTLTEQAPIGILRKGKIEFDSSYKEKPTVSVRVNASVEGPIRFLPPVINLVNLSADDPGSLTKTITVRSMDKTRFKITGVDCTIPEVATVDYKTVIEGQRYEVILQVAAMPALRVFSGRLYVRTDNDLQPSIEVPIRGGTGKKQRAAKTRGASAARTK